MAKYSSYEKYINFINKYKKASNASSGSEVDSNANVDNKNIATMQGELTKREIIGTNRLLMINKITEMFGEDMAYEYIRQLESHEIYKHDETSVMPYTYGAQEVVNVKYCGRTYTVSFERLYEICNETEELIDEVKDVWAKYPNDMYIEDKDGFTRVERLIRKQRHRDLVRVKAAFSNDIIVTDNHPMIVCDNINNTIPASESLNKNQYRCSSKMTFGDIKFVDTGKLLDYGQMTYNTLEHGFVAHTGNNALWYAYPKTIQMDREIGYFVGFFIGDGGFNISNGSIDISQKDSSVLYKIADILLTHFNSPSNINFSINDERYKLIVSNPVVYIFLRNYLGIKPKAQFKTLPENIFEFNRDFAVGIIEGLIDSDGTIGSNGEYSIRLSSRTAIMQIATIVNALGITTGCTTQQTRFGCNEKIKQKYQLFGVNFRDNIDMVFGESYKASKARPITKGKKGSFDEWQTITDVTVIDNGPFLDTNEYIYDITTESHSFVCNGLWVHNCVSITMYPFLFEGLKSIGGMSEPPQNFDSFCGSFINLVFAIAAQFAGAVSTPEFLTYLDYFIRKEYGDNYYLHTNESASLSRRKRTIDDVITDKFSQVVYSLNQPAAARNFQSVFWNLAYFDKNYFDGIFHDFIFPDDTEPQWESVSWLQKRFMKWFNAERLKKPLTFPVETMNLLDDGLDYVDHEWADFAAEMYAEGHSFFTYRSSSVDSLASCCRLRNELQDNTFSFTLGAGGVSTGSKGVITININRLVQNAKRSNRDISEAVAEQVKKVHCYLKAFNEIMKDNFKAKLLPVYDAGYISLEKQFLTVGM
jgi:intein/homing endonuclease